MCICTVFTVHDLRYFGNATQRIHTLRAAECVQRHPCNRQNMAAFNRSTMMAIVALLALMWLGVARAHVALTYPPARHYDLDFLDNARTKGPCGMPKGKRLTISTHHIISGVVITLAQIVYPYARIAGHTCVDGNAE